MSSDQLSPAGRSERRAAERLPVVVPAMLRLDSQDYTAKVLNIVNGGAMLESSAPVEVNSSVLFRCGTVAVTAIVVWSDAGRIGIAFETALSDTQISEQVSRSRAVAAWKQSNRQS